MYCPRCGSNQREDLKFCTACGANLQAVLKVIDSKESGGDLDWSKTWVAEMFLSEGEKKLRQEERERRRGITPEIKRYNEIKAGVIVGSVGIAIAIFLAVFMEGIIRGGKVPQDTAEILSHIWIAGIIPFFVGLALIVNGLFISKKLVEIAKRSEQGPREITGNDKTVGQLTPGETNEFIPASLSVTEETTRHLQGPQKRDD